MAQEIGTLGRIEAGGYQFSNQEVFSFQFKPDVVDMGWDVVVTDPNGRTQAIVWQDGDATFQPNGSRDYDTTQKRSLRVIFAPNADTVSKFEVYRRNPAGRLRQKSDIDLSIFEDATEIVWHGPFVGDETTYNPMLLPSSGDLTRLEVIAATPVAMSNLPTGLIKARLNCWITDDVNNGPGSLKKIDISSTNGIPTSTLQISNYPSLEFFDCRSGDGAIAIDFDQAEMDQRPWVYLNSNNCTGNMGSVLSSLSGSTDSLEVWLPSSRRNDSSFSSPLSPMSGDLSTFVLDFPNLRSFGVGSSDVSGYIIPSSNVNIDFANLGTWSIGKCDCTRIWSMDTTEEKDFWEKFLTGYGGTFYAQKDYKSQAAWADGYQPDQLIKDFYDMWINRGRFSISGATLYFGESNLADSPSYITDRSGTTSSDGSGKGGEGSLSQDALDRIFGDGGYTYGLKPDGGMRFNHGQI